VKRSELLQRIKLIAADAGVDVELFHGGKHDKLKINGFSIAFPRHREIPEGLSKTILKQVRACTERTAND